jgi:hypothetical protein
MGLVSHGHGKSRNLVHFLRILLSFSGVCPEVGGALEETVEAKVVDIEDSWLVGVGNI